MLLLLHLSLLLALAQLGQASCPSSCLAVFTHTPRNLPKCYCTDDVCPQSLDSLVHSCASNELHPANSAEDNSCAGCLTCARALGQTCGGAANAGGVCAGGLLCKVEDESKDDAVVGVCVSEASDECPRATDVVAKKGVTCRPGKRGILAEALYCPTLGRAEAEEGTTTSRSTTSSSTTGGSIIREKLLPALVDHFLDRAKGYVGQ